MPFIPHTDADRDAMLDVLGAPDVDALFDEIPANLRCQGLPGIAPGRSEQAMLEHLGALADRDDDVVCFAGAGCYDHHIPAAVWDVVARGEFMTAYTPYQAEASQGTLQLIYEYQSMMTALLNMEVSNASVYDGASALAEAALMAVRAQRKVNSRTLLVPVSLNPLYRRALHAIVSNQGLELKDVPVTESGVTDLDWLARFEDDFCALIIPQPNVFGCFEPVDALVDWAHERSRLTIAVVNPLAMALVKAPGNWGGNGADIVCGDGQPLGIPMASGGPSFGFMATRQSLVRQMPGRIIGKTDDGAGNVGFALTLQAREQHIRRAKATSNICTNQGLLVTAATIHMSIMGPAGLTQAARKTHANTLELADMLCEIPSVERLFDTPSCFDVLLRVPGDASALIETLAEDRILAGVDITALFSAATSADALDEHPQKPAFLDSTQGLLLVSATEKRSRAQMQRFAQRLAATLN